MRKADWLIGFLIAAVVLVGIYYFVRAYKSIQSQNPDRPSVEETLSKTGNGETVTLDEEDEFNDEFADGDPDTISYEPDGLDIDDLTDLNNSGKGKADATEGKNTLPSDYEDEEEGVEEYKRFLVVAGTYKQMSNAEVQLKKLKNMGYTYARIGKFNRATYASIIVDRFSSVSEAKKLVRTLEDKGIPAYVHKKRIK